MTGQRGNDRIELGTALAVQKSPISASAHLLGRRLRYQRVEAFRFSSPLVSALLNLVDGCRKELLSVQCLLLYFTQLFNLDAQHV